MSLNTLKEHTSDNITLNKSMSKTMIEHLISKLELIEEYYLSSLKVHNINITCQKYEGFESCISPCLKNKFQTKETFL